jgi:hypothetical protein
MDTGSLPGVKGPGRGVDHPPQSSAEVKEYSYTSTPPLGFHGLLQGEIYLYFILSNRDLRRVVFLAALYNYFLPKILGIELHEITKYMSVWNS